MKTGPALALIAVGAILAFAVHAHLNFFSFQIAGWVIMLTGIAGLVIPRRGHSWLRRVTRRPGTAAGAGGGGRLRQVTRRSGAAAGTDGGGRMPIGSTFRRRPNPARSIRKSAGRGPGEREWPIGRVPRTRWSVRRGGDDSEGVSPKCFCSSLAASGAWARSLCPQS